MLKRTILLLLAIIIPISAISCSKPPEIPKTQHIISTLCEAEINLPAGMIYSSDIESTNKNYLSDRLLASYFGEPNIEKYKKDWISYSIFTNSSGHVCEFAAIYCATPESLTDTSRMLQARLDSLKKLNREDLSEYIDNAQIVNIRNYAILVISSDTRSAVKLLKKVC